MYSELEALMRLLCLPVLMLMLVCAQGCTGQNGGAKRVRLAEGHTSATYQGAVVRGTRDRYLVRARAGQSMTVSISSVEQNAVFSIADPSGAFMKGAGDEDDATHWHGMLSASGDFAIEVGGTRGNAEYALTIVLR